MKNNFYQIFLVNKLKPIGVANQLLVGIILMIVSSISYSSELSGEYRNTQESVIFDPSDKSVIINTRSIIGLKVMVHGNYKVKNKIVYVFDLSGNSFGVFTIADNGLIAKEGSHIKSLMSPNGIKNERKLILLGGDIFNKNEGGSSDSCYACHQKNAAGSSEMAVPNIRNMSKRKFMAELESYKNDTRRDTTMFRMNSIAKSITLNEAEAIWHYINSLN